MEFFSFRISVWFFSIVLISLVKYAFGSLILFLNSLNCLSGVFFCLFFVANRVSLWQLFWVLYQLVHNLPWLQGWFLENCYCVFVVLCYHGISWFLMSHFSADILEVANTFLRQSSAYFDSNNPMKVKVKLLSCVWLFATPWTVAYQAPPSMGFSRQEYWSGVPLPSPGDWGHSMLKSRGWQALSVKGQTGFAGCKISVATTQLCPESVKVAADS